MIRIGRQESRGASKRPCVSFPDLNVPNKKKLSALVSEWIRQQGEA
jgi:hypothetical protein